MNNLTFNMHFIDLCNFHCKHCFIEKNNKELSIEKIKLIANKLSDYSRKNNINIRINLAGGEPLLSKNIQFIIDYLYSLDFEISLITNGYYLNDDFLKTNRYKLSMIGISVDSLSHDTNLIIGRNCNGITLSKADLISKCRSIKKYGIKLKINTCVTSLNLKDDINELIEVVKPDRFKLLRSFCDETHKEFRITDEEWGNAINKYPSASIHEDNEFMSTYYLIIDSEGNLSRNNLHLTNNSLLNNDIEKCLKNIGM